MKKLLLALSLASGVAQSASPFIWGADNMAENLAPKGFYLADGKQYISLLADPSSGGGISAPIGSIGLRNNAGSGEGWLKVGAANTAWASFLTGASAWGLSGNGGTNPATNFLGTTDAVDLVLRSNNLERFRITSAGVLDTTLGVGLIHSNASGELSSSLLVNSDVDASAAIAYSKLNLSNSIVNADVATAAAIAGTKISPNFGAQNIVTTGTLSVLGATVTGLSDGLVRSTTGLLSGAGTVSLTSEVTGVLPVANGGTSKALTVNDGAIAYTDADSFELLDPGTSGFVLTTNGAGAPSWVDPATFVPTSTLQLAYDGGNTIATSGNPVEIRDDAPGGSIFKITNDDGTVAYADFSSTEAYFGTDVFSIGLIAARDGFLWIDSATGFQAAIRTPALGDNYTMVLPSGNAAGVMKNDGSGTLSFSPVSLTADVDGILPLANGGTNKDMVADNGGVVWTDADSQEVLAAGTAGQILTSGGAATPTWATARSIANFTTSTITLTAVQDQVVRYTATAALTVATINAALLPNGGRLTVMALSNDFPVTIPQGIVGAQNGDAILNVGGTISYIKDSTLGLVEVSRNGL